MNPRFLGRDPTTVITDMAAAAKHIEDLETAAAVWHSLQRLAQDDSASWFTRQRAKTAAFALGSILNDLAAADADNR